MKHALFAFFFFWLTTDPEMTHKVKQQNHWDKKKLNLFFDNI